MKRGCLLALILGISTLAWAGSARVRKSDLGDEWPLKVDEGILECSGARGVGEVTFTAGGVTYAVNGLAKGTKKYKSIEPIWKDNVQSEVKGLKMSIGPLIHRGLKLCR
jgi:hypothetical protein